MNQQLTSAELASLPVALPVMTKRDKLLRLARLIRECGATPNLYLFSNIEHRPPSGLAEMQHPLSAFAVAAQDRILKDAGLTGPTVGEAQKFFQLSRDDLHAFSCDCGGHLTNDQMARRVESLAACS
jgi:hypothetical protein